MPVPFLVHPNYILDQIHPVFAAVVEPTDKGRNKHLSFLRPCGRSIHSRRLLLAETQSHIYPHTFLHCLFRRLKTLYRCWIFNMGIGNPSIHFFPLLEHLFRCRVLIGIDFNGNGSLWNTARNFLYKLLVKSKNLFFGKFLAAFQAFFCLRIF